MKKLNILATMALIAIASSEALCSTILISVELPNMESKKAWHQLNIPTYELIGSIAISEVEENQISFIKQKGYQINIIDQQPDLTKYVIVSNIDRTPGLHEISIWQKDKMAIIKGASKDAVKDVKYKHQIRPMNNKPLGDRYWTSATTKYVPLKSIPYDPFIQSLVDQVNADSIVATIQRLQDFQTRQIFTDSCHAASEWIYNKFIEWGCQAELDSVYIDIVPPEWERSPICTIQGSCAKIIIACGHYDTAPLSSPGADDDASGVAGAMEIARIFRKYSWESTMKFAGWVGEEYGGNGSNHFATASDTLGLNITGVVNFDMLGYMSDAIMKGLVWHMDNNSGWLSELFIDAGKTYVPAISYEPEISFIACDQYYFERAGYPAITAIESATFSNPYFHTAHDSLHYLEPAMIKAFTQTALATMAFMSNCPFMVESVVVADVGDGTQLNVNWEENQESDLAGYRVYWGEQSGVYGDSITVGVNNYVITGLTTDSTYYIYIRAVDSDGNVSLSATEETGIPRVVPLPPTGLVSIPKIMSINLTWRSGELDLAGYRLFRKIDEGLWDSLNLSLITDTVYIDSVPSETARYWYRIRAIDADGNASLLSDSIGSYTYAPSGLTATPVVKGIGLSWPLDSTKNISGYRLYRKINQSAFDSLAQTTFPNVNYTDSVLSGANKYYYKLRAYDSDGNYSLLSDSVYCRPISLDQGILLVDETYNWITGSYPRDAQQDSFYNYILAGYKITGYEYGLTDPKPVLADFGPYSTVAWFADDYATMLASGAVNDMKSYLAAGGKLWFAGWKPTWDIRNSATYPADVTTGNILYDYFNISHVELSGTADSFKTAVGLRGYPDILVDTLKYPSTIYGKTMRYIEALTPLSGADTIYVMDMKNNGSLFEGKACAVRDSGKTVFFGFPMYFMDKEQAKLVAQKVLAEFGEPLGVTGKPENREQITSVRLFQNAPNPFKNQTAISYQLPKAGQVKLNIYNIAGQLVKTLVNSAQAGGDYSLKWDGRDDGGLQVSNGVYVYKLDAAGIKGTKKMLLLR